MNIQFPNARRFILTGFVICLTLLFTTMARAGEYVSVQNDGVNVRSGPSTNDEVRWEVFKNFPLQITKRQGDWVQVTDFEGDIGWIYSSLLSPSRSVIVRKSKVNLRDQPTTNKDTRVIAVVKYGVVFTPLEKKGDWLKVRHADGTTGWISKDLVWPSDPLD
jgi:SH3-like domain-containing protein